MILYAIVIEEKRVMEQPTLVNQHLIRSIFEKYYLKEEHSQDEFVSSHWEFYSKKFKVRIDREGNILSLSGEGFGDMVSRDPVQKLLSYLCHLSYLIDVPNKLNSLRLMHTSFKICKSTGFYFSFDCFKQVCSLGLIMKYMSEEMKRKRLIFMVIGDGYGFLSSLIKSTFPDSTIVLVDIGKTLLFQAFYCQKAHPECIHSGIDEEYDLETTDFLYCPTEHLEKIEMFNYDVAINIASMQEMNFQTIERYFSFLRRNCNIDNLFYCCNRELKVLPGGEVVEFKKYPWDDNDKHLIDEYCPWYKYFLSLLSCQAQNGPRIFGIRIPFINYFDGPILHRLTVLSTNKNELFST